MNRIRWSFIAALVVRPGVGLGARHEDGDAGTERASITAGPDGVLWFTFGDRTTLGRITTAGLVTEYEVPIPPSQSVGGIATGPGRKTWYVASEQKVMRINVP
jgi:streptogramin lyase